MSAESAIKSKFQEMFSGGITLPITCEVVSVQGNSCTVKIQGGLEIPDVRLRATLTNAADELILTPKAGSKALAWSITGDYDDLVLLRSDRYESVKYTQDGLEVLLESQTKKVTVKNQSASLYELMDSVHSIISNIIVLTPQGPSTGLDPSSILALTAFETKFKNLLNP